MLPFDITVEDLKKMRDEEIPHQLIDCRRPDEFAAANIGGILIEMQSIPQHLGELSTDEPLVVMCHVGGRSARVVQFLRQQGFENAQNLAGGIDAWSVYIDPTVKRY
jgi:rhodanese-related sulfurtransferase